MTVDYAKRDIMANEVVNLVISREKTFLGFGSVGFDVRVEGGKAVRFVLRPGESKALQVSPGKVSISVSQNREELSKGSRGGRRNATIGMLGQSSFERELKAGTYHFTTGYDGALSSMTKITLLSGTS